MVKSQLECYEAGTGLACGPPMPNEWRSDFGIDRMARGQIAAVIERVRTWPKARQEDAALLLLALETQDGTPYALSDEERIDLEQALEEVDRGDIATEAEVADVFSGGDDGSL